MAYFNNDVEAAEMIAKTLRSYPDTSWDNVDRLVRRAMSQYGYRPTSGRAVVLKVVEILKQEGKFNDWGDPSMILPEATKHRQIMDKHFKRAREYLYGFPTATQGDECDKDDAGSTTIVMPVANAGVEEEEQVDSVADEPIAEEAPMGMSDEVAAKKIAAKLMGTPDLTFPKIQQMVTRYLGMVGKAPTDAKHLSVLVFDELQELELAESGFGHSSLSNKPSDDFVDDDSSPSDDHDDDHHNVDPDQLGLLAYRNGQSLSQCPYDEDFEPHSYEAWVRGWRYGASEAYADAPIDPELNENDDDLDDQAYLDKREGDYMADAGPGLVKGEFVSYGHKFDTYVFDDIDAANAFMAENSGWGAIGEDTDGKIHVANMDDEGSPLNQVDESDDNDGDIYQVSDHDIGDVVFTGQPKVADDFVALSSDLMIDIDDPETIKELIADANKFLREHDIWECEFLAVDVSNPENFVWTVKHTGNEGYTVDEAQEAVVHIPRDQDKSFKDEVLVGGTDGPEQDMNYIKRLKSLAGLK